MRSFRGAKAFEAWLSANHDREPEVWVRIFKKGSGLASVTAAEALDVVLCWGWIDGIRKSFDEDSYPQRYTPRRAKSIWSQKIRGCVAPSAPRARARSTSMLARRARRPRTPRRRRGRWPEQAPPTEARGDPDSGW